MPLNTTDWVGMNGTILDVQPAQNGTSLDVWLVDDASGSMKVNVQPAIQRDVAIFVQGLTVGVQGPC